MQYVSNPSRLRRYLKDTRSLYYYFNKAMRRPALRNILFKSIRLVLPKGHLAPPDDTELQRVNRDGIVCWDRLIDAATVAKIRAYLAGKPVFDVRDLGRTPIALPETVQGPMKFHYFPADVAACKEFVAIANDEHILSLVTGYFGCKPIITIMDAWWTKTNGPSQELFQDDMYHRDVEDFKFIKLFVYLKDVVAENGAHCFIRGSQRSTALTARRPIADSEVEIFDEKDRLIITGNAGSGFLENTWGLHRSLPATRGERIIFSVTYSLTSLNPQSPKTPLMENTGSVDPYINQVYLKT